MHIMVMKVYLEREEICKLYKTMGNMLAMQQNGLVLKKLSYAITHSHVLG